MKKIQCYHVELIVGEDGPVAIMSEIPSLRESYRDEILEISRRHSNELEAIITRGIKERST